MTTPIRQRRDALRAMGLRPVQIWVPDTRRPGFLDECRRQAQVVAVADALDTELGSFVDAAFQDLAETQALAETQDLAETRD